VSSDHRATRASLSTEALEAAPLLRFPRCIRIGRRFIDATPIDSCAICDRGVEKKTRKVVDTKNLRG
jgi:hypothetical protein